jgi:hypothetical protein
MSNVDSLASLRGACERVAPVHPGYADLPIEEGFDWEPLREAPFGRLYLVVFRSLRREGADLDLLRERDRLAHQEAIGMGGLLRYFKGEANERRGCLSFCLWERGGTPNGPQAGPHTPGRQASRPRPTSATTWSATT